MNAKKVLVYLLLLIDISGISERAHAQFSMFGKEFYTAFGPNSPEQVSEVLFLLDIVSFDTANVQIVAAGKPFSNNITVIPGIMTQVQLDNVECKTPDQILTAKAVKITSDKDIQVTAISSKQFSSDAWVVYPTSLLGKEYFSLNYPTSIVQGSPGEPSEIVLVATEDSTVLSITPTHNLENQQPPTLFAITLNRGDVYVVEGDPKDSTNDLTGSHITSNKAFAVISGHRRTEIPSGNMTEGQTTSRDCLYEQLPPVDRWSDSVIVVPSSLVANTGPDLIRIISATDHNVITINDQSPGYINKGEFFEVKSLSSPQIIKGSDPILVGQYIHSCSTPTPLGDPSLTIGYSLQKRDADLLFSTPEIAGISQQTLTVILNSSGSNNVIMDGTPIPNQAFTKIGPGPFAFREFNLSQGLHTIRCSSPYSVKVEGAGSLTSYAYTLPFDYQQPPLSVDKVTSANLTFSDIMPNPTSQGNKVINISYSAKTSSNIEFSIYDISGKELVAIKKATLDVGKGTLPIQLPVTTTIGTYFLKINPVGVASTNAIVRKFVVR